MIFLNNQILIKSITFRPTFDLGFNFKFFARKLEISILSPENFSYCGLFALLRFQLEHYDDNGFLTNPSHLEYTLKIQQEGSMDVTSLTYYPAVTTILGPLTGSGSKSFHCSIIVVDKTSTETLEYGVSTDIVLNVITKPSLEELFLRFETPPAYQSINLVLLEMINSLIIHYKELASSVLIACNSKHIRHEVMVVLSPQVIDIFNWITTSADYKDVNYSYDDKTASSVNRQVVSLISSMSRLHFRAHYDVSVVVFTGDDIPFNSQETYVQILTNIIEYLRIVKTRTVGHLIVALSFDLYYDVLLTLGAMRYGDILEDFIQQIDHDGFRILIYYKSSENRLTSLESSTEASVAMSSMNYLESGNGLSYLRIQNGCIDRYGELVLLVSSTDQHIPVLDDLTFSQLNSLNTNYSNFMPFFPMRQVILDYNDKKKTDEIVWYNATAALVKPYFTYNIHHHFQSLSGLLSIQDIIDDPIQFLLMSSFERTAHSLYDWQHGVTSLVTEYYRKQLWSSDEDHYVPMTTLYREDINSLFSQQEQKNMMCFKDLMLVGQATISRGFFVNSSVQSKFSQFSYDTYADTTVNSTVFNEKAKTTERVTRKKSNYKLKVLFGLRSGTRRIVNLPALHTALLQSGVVDLDWLNNIKVIFNIKSAYVYLDTLTLQDQIKLFKDTDLFIGTHGASFINAALFMQLNSVCIEIMPARYIDPSFPQLLHQAQVKLFTMYVTDHNMTANCPHFPPECVQMSLSEANHCLMMRNCDVVVDDIWFQGLIELAAHHVRANKNM